MPKKSQYGGCFILFLSIICYGLYFYYEIFVQSNIRYPRNLEESAILYEFATEPIEGDLSRFSQAWFFMQSHHLYGLGVAMLGASYMLSKELRLGSALGPLCFCYFGSVFVILIFSVISWFYFCHRLGVKCIALRNISNFDPPTTSFQFEKNTSIELQVPLFYIVMTLISLFLAIFSCNFFEQSYKVQKSNDDNDDDEKSLLNDEAQFPTPFARLLSERSRFKDS